MNKKSFIIAVVVIILIITTVIIFKHREEDIISLQQENKITKKEYDDNLIENIEEKLSSAGIEVIQNEITRFKSLEGKRYVVVDKNDETEKIFEIYPINVKEKKQMLGKNNRNGKVIIDKTTQGILSGNVLILNISDEELTNQIMEALNM